MRNSFQVVTWACEKFPEYIHVQMQADDLPGVEGMAHTMRKRVSEREELAFILVSPKCRDCSPSASSSMTAAGDVTMSSRSPE